MLIGPEGAGKSHLATIWAQATGAQVITPADWHSLPRTPAALVVEDADRLPPETDEPFFHLHNRMMEAGGHLLITARHPPAFWPVRLADLSSRMLATATVTLADPDDALFPALLAKLFADRQILPPPDLVPWLAARLERSHRAALAAVRQLDEAALAQGREITRALARQVLDITGGPGAD
jgi:chromosomal replication initiation ATPase DnaA